MKVLVLGGYGVFGSRLSRLLLRDGHQVLVTGRRWDQAQAFVEQHGGTPLELDMSNGAALSACLTAQQPDVVIDAAGPFQAYGSDPYRIARSALEHGCHYLDLSDDAEFCAGISVLNDIARSQGRVALSGLSSVPALSSAVVAHLAQDMDEIALIESTILPGNRAPRGRSVMQAILSQIGKPMRLWRGGRWVSGNGWGGRQRIALAIDLVRYGNFIGAPDLMLFPRHFGARSVLFRAGLELGVMHWGLDLLGRLHRWGLLPPLDRMTPVFQWIANLLQPFGSDRGGMRVSVSGRVRGQAVLRNWTLIAEAGEGPFVPAIPARIMIAQLARGDAKVGARPALSEFSLNTVQSIMDNLAIGFHHMQEFSPRLFETALGEDWGEMPASYRQMHDVWDMQWSAGKASVVRGKHPLARLIALMFRFPPATDQVDVAVRMERRGESEIWRRRFGKRKFRSVLTNSRPGHVFERFGPMKFELSLPVRDGQMAMNVTRGWCLGVPIPRSLLPKSNTREYVREGRFHFDVRISAPIAGLIVHYQGWLKPVEDHPL